MNESIKSFEEFERIRNLPIDERLEYEFTEYLKSFNQSNEIIEFAKKINWKQIIKIYEEEFNYLWEKFTIPQNIDGLKGIGDSFCLILLKGISHNLFHHLFLRLKGQSNLTDIKTLNENIIWNLDFIIREYLAPYYFQLGLTNLNEYDNEKFTIIKIKELKDHAERGKKFMRGKRNRPNEKEYRQKVISKYLEEKKNKLNPSFRKIAINVARIDLELIHEKEQISFYKRCIAQFNKTKKKEK